MRSLLRKIERNLLESCGIPEGARLVLAVSGGGDSMVMCHALQGLAKRHGWQLDVAHLNHQLRGRAGRLDQELVRRGAEKYGLKFHLAAADVRRIQKGKAVSLEMAAREARHQFLAETAKGMGASHVLLAHHADDQAELFFIRLLRGAGGEGLGGMRFISPSPWDKDILLARPLLDIPKSHLRDFARQQQILFREDRSNKDTKILRNWLRLKLLPVLQTRQPAISTLVTRIMDIVAAESAVVEAIARPWLAAHIPSKNLAAKPCANLPGAALDASVPFQSLQVAVQRAGVRLQLLDAGLPAGFDLVEKLRLQPDTSITVTRGCQVKRLPDGTLEQGRPRERVSPPLTTQVVLLDGEGSVDLDETRVTWRIAPRPAGATGKIKLPANTEWFDAEKVGAKVVIRRWRAGDRYQPIGMPNPIKLQDVFVNLKVPKTQRHRRWLAENHQGEIFWVEDLRIGERFKLDKQTRTVLQWSWVRLP